jgi:hypothetical protein
VTYYFFIFYSDFISYFRVFYVLVSSFMLYFGFEARGGLVIELDIVYSVFPLFVVVVVLVPKMPSPANLLNIF